MQNTKTDFFNKTLFQIRLALSLTLFVARVAIANLHRLLKNLKILLFLYILLFIQALLVIFYPKDKTPQQLLIRQEQITTQSNQLLNWEQIEDYRISGTENRLLKELESYRQFYQETNPVLFFNDGDRKQNNQQDSLQEIEEKNSYNNSLWGRDALINLALLNLALENHLEFEKFIDQALELDPNWQGWQ